MSWKPAIAPIEATKSLSSRLRVLASSIMRPGCPFNISLAYNAAVGRRRLWDLTRVGIKAQACLLVLYNVHVCFCGDFDDWVVGPGRVGEQRRERICASIG
jgi:hypothetical protein